ncbi:Aldo/keto reductase [Mycena rebaudengoi]|nr:Aldo/keto reductase [Mycena rebaudengoi]
MMYSLFSSEMSSDSLPKQKSALNVVLGAMAFGAPGTHTGSITELKDIEAILDIFVKQGHHEVDTARFYNMGTSEEYLGKINWTDQGILMETKLYPSAKMNASHSPEDLRKHLMASLKALNTDKLEMWYLHAPDRSVPYEVTLKAVDELYKEGHFKRFGISNYMSWEVAELVGICKRFGYIKPTVYQGVYSPIHRAVEPELFPCLRKFGISFYAFSPSMQWRGDYLPTSLPRPTTSPETNSRFDPETLAGKEPYFNALAAIRPVAEKHNLSMAEVALRWISHHSLLKREYGDAVIIGGSRLSHVEQNLADLDKGPLPEEVVTAVDEAWPHVKAMGSNYYL